MAKCPACQWQTKVAQSLLGKKIRCKQCAGIILVSAPESSANSTLPSSPETSTPSQIPTPSSAKPATPDLTPAPKPVRPDPAPAVLLDVTSPPASEARPSPAAPPPASVSQATSVFLGEISDLRNKLDAARKETSRHFEHLSEADRRLKAAERRTQEAETEIHNLAGKMAIETMTANRRISELESYVVELEKHIATLLQEYKAELGFIEQRAAMMRGKLASFEE